MSEPLTDYEVRFCQEYAACLNAAEAIRRTGRDVKHPKQRGHQMMQKPQVRARIEELIDVKGAHARTARVAVWETLTNILGARLSDCFGPDGNPLPLDQMPEGAQLALAEFSTKEYSQGDQTGKTVRLRLADKLTACAQLAKLLGMLRDVDPMEAKREQMGEAKEVIKDRMALLKQRLSAKFAGQELSLAEMAALEDVEVV